MQRYRVTTKNPYVVLGCVNEYDVILIDNPCGPVLALRYGDRWNECFGGIPVEELQVELIRRSFRTDVVKRVVAMVECFGPGHDFYNKGERR